MQCDLTFKEGRKLIRKDERYEPCADVLEKAIKERLFDEHMRTLSRKRYDQLKNILSGGTRSFCPDLFNYTSLVIDINTLTLQSRWSDAKRALRDDERIKKLYGNNERVCSIALAMNAQCCSYAREL